MDNKMKLLLLALIDTGLVEQLEYYDLLSQEKRDEIAEKVKEEYSVRTMKDIQEKFIELGEQLMKELDIE